MIRHYTGDDVVTVFNRPQPVEGYEFPRQIFTRDRRSDSGGVVYPSKADHFWCAILIAHQIVMAKHGGSCVHFSGISTCGETSRETVSHSQRKPLPTPHKIAVPVYVTVTNKRLQPLTTTLYNSLVLSFSLLTTKRRLIKHRSFLRVLRSWYSLHDKFTRNPNTQSAAAVMSAVRITGYSKARAHAWAQSETQSWAQSVAQAAAQAGAQSEAQTEAQSWT